VDLLVNGMMDDHQKGFSLRFKQIGTMQSVTPWIFFISKAHAGFTMWILSYSNLFVFTYFGIIYILLAGNEK
jgi:hypothetical protein